MSQVLLDSILGSLPNVTMSALFLDNNMLRLYFRDGSFIRFIPRISSRDEADITILDFNIVQNDQSSKIPRPLITKLLRLYREDAGKIPMIKAVREELELSLRDAKNLVDSIYPEN